MEDNYTPETRPWHTLVHVLEIDRHNDCDEMVWLGLPGWSPAYDDPEVPVSLSLTEIPCEVASCLREDMRLHARVNIGAPGREFLVFRNWEIPE